MKPIIIVYRRLPEKTTRYRQLLLYEDAQAVVSLGLMAPSQPLMVEGRVLVERGDVAVWFIFPNAWHDTGLVYSRDRRFKGYYCDIVMPAKPMPEGYEMTDLFLDLWVYPDGDYLILDREEFDEALRSGWLSKSLADRAEAELQRLIQDVRERRFTKPIFRTLGALPENVAALLDALREGGEQLSC